MRMAAKAPPSPNPEHRRRGFEPAFGLMKDAVRTAGEARGFAVARLLTHWAEVVGPEMAAKTRPVKIGYGKGAMGATLTLLVKASEAPMVQMALPVLKERVNAVGGRVVPAEPVAVLPASPKTLMTSPGRTPSILQPWP